MSNLNAASDSYAQSHKNLMAECEREEFNEAKKLKITMAVSELAQVMSIDAEFEKAVISALSNTTRELK